MMSTRKFEDTIIFIFLDGFGLARPGNENPLSGSAFTVGAPAWKNGSVLKALDAGMGVEGIPQSATGQTALLTGVNAAEVMGFHQPAFPGLKLKAVIDEHNILRKVIEKGGTATFANAYTPKYFKLVEEQKRAHSVTTLSVLSAGISFRMMEELLEGEAVYWDITNAYLKENHLPSVPLVSPREAGRRLARLGEAHTFTLFECFKPDLLGHRMDRDGAILFMEQLDAFLEGVIEQMSSTTTLLLSSDHGNMEHITSKPHTENPVPLFALGPLHKAFDKARNITDVAPIILDNLNKSASIQK